jgi:serine/threonine protein kinase
MENRESQQANAQTFASELSEFGYTYIREIGCGTFGKVHLVLSKQYNQYFAIKEATKFSKFDVSHEFEILKQLLHPNILNLYSMLKFSSSECLVLEYCSGGTLEDLVKSHGPIQPPTLYRYCLQILSAVEYMHQNQIAHRDIKPSNIMLDSYDRIKLTDFGLSMEMSSSTKSTFEGTIMYMAPELLNKIKGYDTFLADIYSLGVTFYFMSQGIDPFVSSNKNGLISLISGGYYPPLQNIDPLFRKIICQMMSINPKNRPNISSLISNPIFHRRNSTTPYCSFIPILKHPASKLQSKSVNYN